MPSDPGFKTYVLDQLTPLGPVLARAMFGGYGLYADGLFFGLIADNRLFFKTSPTSREPYLERGMSPFSPRTGQTLVNYYEVPPDVLDDQSSLVAWARQAVDVARAATMVQPPGTRERRTRSRQAQDRS